LDVDENAHGIVTYTVPASEPRGTEENPRKLSGRIVCILTEIRTGYIPNTVQDCYHLNQIGQSHKSIFFSEVHRSIVFPLHFFEIGRIEKYFTDESLIYIA
jgi:hypothetical protein